eukprot:13178465-Ditylum_brightwellii.AAC.1
MPMEYFPEEIIQQYQLKNIVHKGHIHIEIKKGMYSLPQAGKLANEQLTEHLSLYGYYHVRHMPGLWQHTTRDIQFTLVVDDFGVKYTNKDDVQHLMQVLRDKYIVSEDWEGKLYYGLTLDWNYTLGTVDISMPGYIKAALHKFQHPTPTLPEYAPYKWNKQLYGKHPQLTAPIDLSPPLNKAKIKRIQEILGTLLYYVRVVDSTLLMGLIALASQQATATEETAKAVVMILNYCATYPDA